MKSTTKLTASALVLSAIAGHAGAQCSTVFRYGVPDFDQKRIGLDSNGNYHCVPTAALNWMAHAVNHGLANAMGHSSPDWSSSSEYNHVTGRLANMGDFMNTGGIGHDGTTLAGSIDGLIEYFDHYNIPAGFIFAGYRAGGDWSPSPDLMRYHLASGNLINFCFGRYDLDGDQWERDGGHCMTLVRVADACTDNPVIGWNNPSTSSDESNFSQSAFASGSWTLESHLRNIDGEWRTVWEPNTQTGMTEGRRFIDSVTVMLPFSGWTAPPTFLSIRHLRPLLLNNSSQPQVQNIPSPNGIRITGLAPTLRLPGIFLSTAVERTTPAALWFYSDVTERFQQIATLPAGAFSSLIATRHDELIALAGDGSVRKYALLADGTVRLAQQATLPYPSHALAIDDDSDDLFVLARDRRRLLRYTDANLLLPARDYALPAQVILGDDCSMSVDPTDARLWITSEGSPAAYEIARAATADAIYVAGSVPLTQYPAPRSLRFDDRGVMRFISGGVARALAFNPLTGGYAPPPSDLFAGAPASGFLEIARSRSNHDPLLDNDPRRFDLPNLEREPSEVAICPADFNGDNQVDFFDYLDFVAAFDAGDFDADINSDLTLDFFDYVDFVAAYSNGC